MVEARGDRDAAIAASPGAAASPRNGWRRAGIAGATLGVIVVYLWDDLLFAAPVLAATRWWGPGVAFVVLAPAYFGGSVALALLAVRAYDRSTTGTPSRMARWLERQALGRRGRVGGSLMGAASVLGFVVGSVMLGGVLTTWMVRFSGRRGSMVPVALLSSAIFAVGFVGTYSGIVGLFS
ncbi:MAG: hypothetical protein JWN46_3400 [Acidimicrobiales bacterium]|nr:hypothetical protein [Acidimicrobiales bacterium]